jgi:hypothetical protein
VAQSRVNQAKAARQALADELAGMIQDVLGTTQFATKAMKPQRYAHAQMALDAEPTALANELEPDALPHPVAIRSRLGRMERLLAFASVGMMIAAGYFAFSIWGGGGTVAAPAPVVSRSASSADPWGERTRDMARELGSTAVAIDVPGALGMRPQAGSARVASPPRAHAPQAAP